MSLVGYIGLRQFHVQQCKLPIYWDLLLEDNHVTTTPPLPQPLLFRPLLHQCLCSSNLASLRWKRFYLIKRILLIVIMVMSSGRRWVQLNPLHLSRPRHLIGLRDMLLIIMPPLSPSPSYVWRRRLLTILYSLRSTMSVLPVSWHFVKMALGRDTSSIYTLCQPPVLCR